ncbi:MAG: hypothetical protein KBD16_00775 [Candidatus Pacebacteria bacterium]|nr:hypothetical protein [Candidatus Paceibacterota bacterium]
MPDKVTQEIFLCFWKDGKLVAVSRKNGKMELYMADEADYGDSVALFGAGNAGE